MKKLIGPNFLETREHIFKKNAKNPKKLLYSNNVVLI